MLALLTPLLPAQDKPADDSSKTTKKKKKKKKDDQPGSEGGKETKN
jgi:hypothetical protein